MEILFNNLIGLAVLFILVGTVLTLVLYVSITVHDGLVALITQNKDYQSFFGKALEEYTERNPWKKG